MSLNQTIIDKVRNGVVIRGTGLDAAKCWYEFKKRDFNILCFLSKKKINSFRGIQCYLVKDNPYNNELLVIATSIKTYLIIADELRKEGKKEFVDFVYYEWFTKEMVLLHGNCHMDILNKYLMSSPAFVEKYTIYPYPLLLCTTKEFRTEPEIFENIDVWIHQDIRDNNEFGYMVSDNYIRKYVSDSIKEICIPNLYGVGWMFFPQLKAVPGSNELLNDGLDIDGMFKNTDTIIESCVSKGMLIDEIVEYCKGDVIPEIEIKRNFEKYFDKILEREEKWDIKISAFIKENYKKTKLFFDDGHATNSIMEFIAGEVLDKLGIRSGTLYCTDDLGGAEEIVYPCVKKALGLKWNNNDIRKNGKKLANHMDFDEYIREYILWRHMSS